MTQKLLTQYADEIEDLRHEMLFSDEIEDLSGPSELKFLQALALLEQARHVMKEAAIHAT